MNSKKKKKRNESSEDGRTTKMEGRLYYKEIKVET